MFPTTHSKYSCSVSSKVHIGIETEVSLKDLKPSVEDKFSLSIFVSIDEDKSKYKVSSLFGMFFSTRLAASGNSS